MLRKAVVVHLLLAATALPAASAPPLGGTDFLHVSGSRIVDGAGRTVILRGANANGLVDYWRSDLRPPYPIDPAAYAHGRCPADDKRTTAVPLCERDLAQMRVLGFDNLRLPVSWSLLEPTPGHLNRTYVERIAQVVGWAKAQGIWVVIDMHQDAWSKYEPFHAALHPQPHPSCRPEPIASRTLATTRRRSAAFADVAAARGTHLRPAGHAERRVR